MSITEREKRLLRIIHAAADQVDPSPERIAETLASGLCSLTKRDPNLPHHYHQTAARVDEVAYKLRKLKIDNSRREGD